MHSFKLAAALFAAVSAATNIVTFVSQDDVDRIVYTTPNAGVEGPDPVEVLAGQEVSIELVDGFVGNSFAVHKGEGDAGSLGMLAEYNFQAWGDLTFFDVSAIVNSSDVNNVKEMYPKSAETPVSGCSVFPCNNAYYLPDDIQTKSTTETHIIVTLGSNNAAASKRSPAEDFKNVPRNLVREKY